MKENRKFGYTVGIAFCVLSACIFYIKHHFHAVFLVIGTVLVLLAFILPGSLTLVRRGWEKLGMVLGWINTIIILTVLYLLVVVPISLINKLLRNDQLKLKWDNDNETYWETNTVRSNIKQQF